MTDIQIVHAFVEGEEGELIEELKERIAELERERDALKQRLNAWWDGNSACLARIEELKQRLKECVDDYDTLMREKVECEEQRDDAEEAYKQALDDKAVLRDRLAQAEREEGNHA